MKAKFIDTLEIFGFKNIPAGNLERQNDYGFKNFKLIIMENGWLLFKDNNGVHSELGFNTKSLHNIVLETFSNQVDSQGK